MSALKHGLNVTPVSSPFSLLPWTVDTFSEHQKMTDGVHSRSWLGYYEHHLGPLEQNSLND